MGMPLDEALPQTAEEREAFALQSRAQFVRDPWVGVIRATGELNRVAAPLPASPPTISLSVPGQVLIGSDVDFSVTFSNQDPSDVGYGPIVDVILDTTGTDGDDGLGTTSISASYAGIPFTTSGANPTMWVLTFDAAGEVTHPLFRDSAGAYITVDAAAVGASPGDTLVVLRLPFGSFSPDQPPATVNMSVNMSNFADLDDPLGIWARGGYEFGYTPLDDWCCGDPAWPAAVSGWSSSAVIPIVFTMGKTYAGPENETATGPNYTRRYTLTAEIAPGQSITNLTLTDRIPDNMQFAGLVSTSPPPSPTCSLPGGTPDGTVSCDWGAASVGGSAEVEFDFYIPLEDASNARVIDAGTGSAVTSCNHASTTGDWIPLDPRDAPETVTIDPAGCEHSLTDRSIAIQKDVSNISGGGNAPGDTLEYTLNFQISDFFAFSGDDPATSPAYEGVLLDDLLSDGQHFDSAFTPTLQIFGNGFGLAPAGISSGNFDVVCNYTGGPGPECSIDDPAANNGTTTVLFRVSDELAARAVSLPSGTPDEIDARNHALGGRMLGGCVPLGGSAAPDCGLYDDGATTGTLRYRVIIQDSYTDDYPSGDPSVDQGDVLHDTATAAGYVVNTNTFVRTGGTPSDASAESVEIGVGTLTKTVYALNGSTSLPNPVEVKPGDELTYRIVYTLPTSNQENLRFDDFLPLPVFQVGDPNADGAAGPAWTLDTTVSGSVPLPGVVKLGPTDTFYAYTCTSAGPPPTGTPPGCLTPVLSIDLPNNLLTIDYTNGGNNFNDSRHQATTIDLLFTLTVTDDPFADRLFLTNQVQATEGSTQNVAVTSDDIIQIVLTQPVLVSNKGVIWTSNSNGVFDPTPPGPVTFDPPASAPRWSGVINSTNLATTPIDSDLRGVDAEDVISFAIVIENTGSSLKGAFDLILRDDLPPEYQEPPGGYNLQVYYGDGSGPIPFVYPASGPACTGSGVGDPCGPDGIAGTADDIFGYGIELVDPNADQGVCQAHDPTSGNNIIMITFDLQLRDDVVPGDILNTSELVNYAGAEGGPNHLPQPQTDTAQVSVETSLAKALTRSEIENGGNNLRDQLVIGELITYTLTLTVPEGEMPETQIIDTLDSGLAFVQVDTVTASPDLTIQNPIGTGTAPANVTIGNAAGGTGNVITFNLGDIANANRTDGVAETILIEYTAVALNVAGNQGETPTQLNNSAVLSWTRGTETLYLPAVFAPEAEVIEPDLQVVKTFLPDTGDAGDIINATLEVQHIPASDVDAYDVTLADVIPVGMTYVGGSLDCTSGVQDPTSCGESGGTITAAWPLVLDDGTTSVLTFQVRLDNNVAPGQVITNTANIAWTSYPGVPTPSPRSIYNPLSVERTGDTGDAGGTSNDYRDSGQDTVTITPGSDKFLVSTSETHTGAVGGTERLAIGEIARYRMEIQLPEGEAINFQLRDNLPAGMLYLNDGTTTLAFVSNDLGIVSSDSALPSGAPLDQTGNETNVASITPTFVLPGSLIDIGPPPIYSLGTLTNNDRDADQEFVVLEFNALVRNIGGNQSGTSLDDNYEILVDGVVRDTSNTVPAIVAEPIVTLTKVLTTTPQDGGDPAIYRLTFTNASGNNVSDAFDLVLTDTFDGYLTLQSVAVIPDPHPYATITDNSDLPNNLVSFSVSRLNTGDSIIVDVTARVNDDVPVEQDIPNTADITYTSLPDTGTASNPTGSATPGGSGDGDGERNGSGGVNDYATSADGDIILAAPSIDKQVTPAAYTIGEEMAFNALLTLREGVTQGLEFFDDLPVGLAYVSHDVITTAAGSGGMLVSDFNGTLPVPTVSIVGGSGGSLTLDFGDTTTNADNITTNDSFLISVTAVVLNVGTNQDGVSLTNDAELRYIANGSNQSESDSAAITIIEPELVVTKTADDDTPAFSQRVTFTIYIAHTAGSTENAYDLSLVDAVPTLPPGAAYVSGSLRHVAGLAPTSLSDALAPTLTATWDTFTLTDTSTLEYDVDVGDPSQTSLGISYVNTADLAWTSILGVDPNERDGSGGINDYRSASSETVTVTGPDLEIVKDDGGITTTPGGVVVYQIDYTNSGNGTATGVLITETVPLNTTFNASSSTAGWSCANGAPAGTSCTHAPSGGDLTPGENGSIDFAVTVIDPVPAGVDEIQNTVNIADDGTNGVDPTPGNNTDSDTTPLSAAPDLTITKDDGVDTVSPGTVLVYDLVYANVGNQDATGVVFSDVVPVNTSFNQGAIATIWSCDDPDGGGPLLPGDPGSTCTYTLGNLAAGAGGTIQFALTVDDPFPVGVRRVTNTARVDDDGSNGPDPTPGNNEDSDSTNVVTIGNVDITKFVLGTNQGHTSDPDVAIGEIITYRIELTIPPGTIRNATVTDVLDLGLAFDACVSISPSSGNLTTTLAGGFGDACDAAGGNPTILAEPSGSVLPETQGRRITFNLADIANNGAVDEVLTIDYDVVALDNQGNTRSVQLNNDALWRWDSGSLRDAAAEVNVVEPTLTLGKTADRTVVFPGELITFTLTVGQDAISDAVAFDLLLEDLLPPDLIYEAGTLRWTGVGLAPSGLDDTGNPVLQANWTSFPLGAVSEIAFEVRLGPISPGERVTNTARLAWSSLPGDVSSPQSPYNSLSTERYYDPGSDVNVYFAIAELTITAPSLPDTGFAPGVSTFLPPQSESLALRALDEFTLDIPKLGVGTTVVGVPLGSRGWDVTWLGNRAGYLEGTAFPTQLGTSLITAHVYDSSGNPGLFVDLSSLVWGDEIILHVSGVDYVYQVTSSFVIQPDDMSILQNDGYYRLTLLTCRGYDEAADAYAYRLAVQSVLVEVRDSAD